MLTDDQIYKALSDLVTERNRNALEAFKLFIGLYSAIVGGAIWLSLQTARTKAAYAGLSNWLVILVTAVAVLFVIEAKRGWWGYRTAQSDFIQRSTDGKHHIPPPRFFPTLLTETMLSVAMIVACIMFVWFNPLSS